MPKNEKRTLKNSKVIFIRPGDKWADYLNQAARILNLPKSTIEREFHEDYFEKFLLDKGCEILAGEVFSK